MRLRVLSTSILLLALVGTACALALSQSGGAAGRADSKIELPAGATTYSIAISGVT